MFGSVLLATLLLSLVLQREVVRLLGEVLRIAISKYVPGILNQLGLANLLNASNMKGVEAAEAEAEADDDDVPELVENFEDVSKDE